MSPTTKYQHHLLNVYEVEIDGDEARTYTYHTSHQVDEATPDTVYVIVARYRDVLRRVDGRWLIADKRMEVGWMERREYSQAAAVAAEAEQNLAAQPRPTGDTNRDRRSRSHDHHRRPVVRIPISDETRKYLDSIAFGHVIDGELVPSASGATMPIVEPSTGTEIGTVASGDAEDLERAVGAARPLVRGRPLARPRPARQGEAPAPLAELFAEHATVFADLDTLDAGLLRGYTEAIVEFAVAGLDYYSGWPSKISGTIPATLTDVVVNVIVRSRSASSGSSCPGTVRRSSSTSSSPRWRAATRWCSSRPSRRRCRRR